MKFFKIFAVLINGAFCTSQLGLKGLMMQGVSHPFESFQKEMQEYLGVLVDTNHRQYLQVASIQDLYSKLKFVHGVFDKYTSLQWKALDAICTDKRLQMSERVLESPQASIKIYNSLKKFGEFWKILEAMPPSANLSKITKNLPKVQDQVKKILETREFSFSYSLVSAIALLRLGAQELKNGLYDRELLPLFSGERQLEEFKSDTRQIVTLLLENNKELVDVAEVVKNSKIQYNKSSSEQGVLFHLREFQRTLSEREKRLQHELYLLSLMKQEKPHEYSNLDEVLKQWTMTRKLSYLVNSLTE